MTREEAIKLIKKFALRVEPFYEPQRTEYPQAIHMAIEALQAEPKTKCVAQIEADTEEIVRRIKEEYDITDRWVPCSERLPEEFSVLCCNNHGEILIANPFECDASDTGFSAENNGCYMYNCIAWMPLPMPYREGREDYELATEQMEHDVMYEPTYNSEDGSM